MRLVVIVPVRGGSKGLPGKNLAPLAGVPLWERAVAQGRAIGADEVWVSTDVADAATLPDAARTAMVAGGTAAQAFLVANQGASARIFEGICPILEASA